MSPRARALPPEERRAHLTDAALCVLRSRGTGATTRQIAEEAGVAEGTIFRVFASKDDLVQAALRRAFDLGPLLERIEAIDLTLPLRSRLLALVSLLQARFEEIFGLMDAMGLLAPPPDVRGHQEDTHQRHEDHAARHARLTAAVTAVLEPDAARLRVPPGELAHLVRLLTFAGTHRKISDGRTLTPEQIVDVLLDGTRRSG